MRTLYLSYDGALDPLGASQVVPYLLGLAARGVEITLISFEKRRRWAETDGGRDLARRLEVARIRWRPLVYHKSPRLPATLWDLLRGVVHVGREARTRRPQLVHCRGDVAMAMARWAALPHGVRLLYDVRGFFADERAESGSWARGGLIDRTVRAVESANLARASGVAVLTAAARDALEQRRDPLPPHRVIPTCVDISAFRPRGTNVDPEHGLVYSGSLGTWYMAREMVAFARVTSRVVPGRTLFLSPDTEEARRAGATPDWADVRNLAPDEVPAWLRKARALLFFIRPTPAKRASCPTKLAEGLATGLPIVTNSGIGDIDGLLREEAIGVTVDEFSEDAYRRASMNLAALLRDPLTASRCRRVAEMRYSLDMGVAEYHELYRIVLEGGTHG